MARTSVILIAIACAVLMCAAHVYGAAWNSANNPRLMGTNYNYVFNNLALNSTLKTTPWSDTYWPSYMSGIAHRWYVDGESNDFNYTLKTEAQIKSMSTKDLQALSPAEKYDIYMGRYDFPTVRSEWQRTSPDDATWEGLCHGWAPAAYTYDQPQPVTLTGKGGVKVPFGSSDVKALLTYFLAEYAEGFDTTFAGKRCNTDIDQDPSKADIPECADMNAGSFHVVLTNQIMSGTSFVIDRERSIQVWNQPVSGYESTITGSRKPSSGSARGTAKEVSVTTTIYWTSETVPAWKSHPAKTFYLTYSYWLELDSDGKILGGSYTSYERTDFVWYMTVGNFSGYYSAVWNIYQASTGASPRLSAAVETTSTFAKPETLIPGHRLAANEGRITSRQNKETASYENNHKDSWVILPSSESPATSITIVFERFETERYRDKVRIFEFDPVTGQKGAPVAVLHGDKTHVPSGHTITVNGPAAYVSFVTDDVNTFPGFAASYRANF